LILSTSTRTPRPRAPRTKRYTEQIVSMVDGPTRRSLDDTAAAHALTMAELLRMVIAVGLPIVVRKLSARP
jgi:hypothetical protein